VFSYSFMNIQYLLLCLIAPIVLSAQVTFEASANAKKILLNSDFEVTFTLKNAQASRNDFTFPKFGAFNVVSGPNQMQRTQIINGNVSSTLSYSFILTPRKMGTYKIAPATVDVQGQTLSTQALQVEIVEGKQGNDDQTEIFLDASTPVQEVYLGQQIPLDYKIYTNKDISSFKILAESEYQGFYAEELRRYNTRVMKEVIGNIQYSTKIMRRIALFPQQTGTMTIEPMMMQLGIAEGRARNPRDFFFQPNLRRLNVSSDPLPLNVLPLPSNAPESFTGAVGSYKVGTSVDNRNITMDDAFTFRVTVVGNGDMKRVQAPPLGLGDAFELYEPEVVEERAQEVSGEIQSRKVFEYIAVPQKTGQFNVQIEFTYFDPDTVRYVVARSEKYLLNVRAGSQEAVVKQEINTPEVEEKSTLRFIKSQANLKSKTSGFWGSNLFYALTIAPFFLLGIAVVIRRKQDEQNNIDPLLLKQRLARKVADKHLKVAKQHLDGNNRRAFYDEISKAMLGYVNDKLNIRNSELTKDNVIERLQSLGASQVEIERFMRVIRSAEMALFARQSDDDMQHSYKDAADVLVKIEQQIT
ncbi:MAG: BatD family protein, partial [Bacteroidota bacterium]